MKCKIENCQNEKGFANKGFCRFHYQQQLQQKRSKKEFKPIPKVYKSKVKEKRNKLTGETQGQFLFRVLENCTDNCQCCNERLTFKSISNCAHILEKSRESFFIVSNNPKNILYLCSSCHNGFDNIGKSWFDKQNQTFKQLVYDRISYLKNYLTEAQQTHIKDYLTNEN